MRAVSNDVMVRPLDPGAHNPRRSRRGVKYFSIFRMMIRDRQINSLIGAMLLHAFVLAGTSCTAAAAGMMPSVEWSGNISWADGTPATELDGLAASMLEFAPEANALFRDDGKPLSARRRPTMRFGQLSSGKLISGFTYPGRYELRLFGQPLVQFKVTRQTDPQGQVTLATDLPAKVKLPINYLIQSTPGAELMVFNSSGGLVRKEVVGESGYVLIPEAEPFKLAFVATMPKAWPRSGSIAERKQTGGRLGDRAKNLTLTPANARALQGTFGRVLQRNSKRLTSFNSVHFSTWRKLTSGKPRPFSFLAIFNIATGAVSVRPVKVPIDYTGRRLFLDESGNRMLALLPRGEKVYRVYSVNDGGIGARQESARYPAYKFKGRTIRQHRWIIPTFGGIPLEESANYLDVSVEYKHGPNKKAYLAFVKRGGELHKEVIDARKHGPAERRKTTQDALDAHGKTRPLGGEGSEKATYAIYYRYDPILKSFMLTEKTMQEMGGGDFHHPTLLARERKIYNWLELTKGVGRINGHGPFTYVSNEQISRSETENVIGLRGVGHNIDLLASWRKRMGPDWARRGKYKIAEDPINMSEGPYTDLRYRVTERNKPVKVLKVYPQNYIWSTSDNGVRITDANVVKLVDFDKADEPLGADIEIEASADEHASEKSSRHQRDYRPALIKITGEVRDDGGKLLVGAKVAVADSEEDVITGADGKYTLSVSDPEGEGQWDVVMDFSLARRVADLSAELIEPAELIANGREVELTFKLMADGEPLANRSVSINLPEKWKFNDNDVSYIFQKPFRGSVTSGNDGEIRLKLPAPQVDQKKLPKLIDRYQARNPDRRYFPLEGEISILDRENGRFCEVPVILESPFPSISKFTIVDVDAGTWQKQGSKLLLQDRDSDTFTLHIKVYGKIKVAGGQIYRNGMYHDIEGKSLTFYYHPFMMGDDLNDQPGDLLKEFGEFNLQLVNNYIVDIAGSVLLDAALVSKTGTIIRDLGKDGGMLAFTGKLGAEQINAARDGIDKLYGGGKATLAVMGSIDKLNGVRETIKYQELDEASAEQQVIDVGDSVFGFIDADPTGIVKNFSFGNNPVSKWTQIVKTGSDVRIGVAKYNLQVEALKVVYANCAFALKLHRQFEAVANSYQDTLFMPVTVEVTDADGHTVQTLRQISVRAWKKAR